jgi:hypothetical protein
MVDGRCFDLAGPGLRGEQKERKAVRAPGDSDAELGVTRHERVEIAAEAVYEVWRVQSRLP